MSVQTRRLKFKFDLKNWRRSSRHCVYHPNYSERRFSVEKDYESRVTSRFLISLTNFLFLERYFLIRSLTVKFKTFDLVEENSFTFILDGEDSLLISRHDPPITIKQVLILW